MIDTTDPYVKIADCGPGWVIYVDSGNRKRWIMRGVCNQCGECESEQGRPDIVWDAPKGTPGACRDLKWETRRDIPAKVETPQHCPSCSLTGEYLSF